MIILIDFGALNHIFENWNKLFGLYLMIGKSRSKDINGKTM